MCLLYVVAMNGGRHFSSVFAITERWDMGLYDVPLSISLLEFGMESMLANFHVLWLRAVLNMLVRNAST